MNEIKQLLENVKNGSVSIDDAVLKLKPLRLKISVLQSRLASLAASRHS